MAVWACADISHFNSKFIWSETHSSSQTFSSIFPLKHVWFNNKNWMNMVGAKSITQSKATVPKTLKNVRFFLRKSFTRKKHTLQGTKLSTLSLIFGRGNLQKQIPEVFYKEGVLKNVHKFTGKHLCQSLFFTKVAGLRRIRGLQMLAFR